MGIKRSRTLVLFLLLKVKHLAVWLYFLINWQSIYVITEKNCLSLGLEKTIENHAKLQCQIQWTLVIVNAWIVNNLSLVNIFGVTGRLFYNINYMLNPAVTYATSEHQGRLFWITCKRPKLLRIAGRLQLIQNLTPSVAGMRQCCIRIRQFFFLEVFPLAFVVPQ